MKPRLTSGIVIPVFIILYVWFLAIGGLFLFNFSGRIISGLPMPLLAVILYLASKLVPRTFNSEILEVGPRITWGRVALIILLLPIFIIVFGVCLLLLQAHWQQFAVGTVLYALLALTFARLEKLWAAKDSENLTDKALIGL